MNPPKIQGLGITQEWSTTSWKATGHVDGVGWLEVWGSTLIEAMEALQALAAQQVANTAVGDFPKPPSAGMALAGPEGPSHIGTIGGEPDG